MPSVGPHQPDGIDGAGRQLHERKLLQPGLSDVAELVETQPQVQRSGAAELDFIRASYKFIISVSEVWAACAFSTK